MNDFKKRVLDIAINQINEKTDIKVKVEQHKTGRAFCDFPSSLSKTNGNF